MAQPVFGIQKNVEPRLPPQLHLEYGKYWDQVRHHYGYTYLGSAGQLGSLRAPHWSPSRVVAVSPKGEVSLWRNACTHALMRLVPASRKLHYEPWGDVKCFVHHQTVAPTGNVIRCGAIPTRPDAIPQSRCPQFKHEVWRGLVFELGQNAQSASTEFFATLAFIEANDRGIFDFSRTTLAHSMYSYQKAGGLVTLDNYAEVRHFDRHPTTLGPLLTREYQFAPAQGDPIKEAVIQFMGFNEKWLDTPLGRLYQKCELALPTYGAAWVTTRMGFMLERYPGVIVVSQLFTPDPNRWWECVLYHDFYFEAGVTLEYIKQFLAAFKKTGKEDEYWCHLMTENFRSLITDGLANESYGYHDMDRENFGPWVQREALHLIERLKSEANLVTA